VVLHHHRLAILAIVDGRQPMHHGPYSIIFNGEIYNHLEVREKLRLQANTHSDTETILLAYEKMGADCLREFDGMFAFAILDRNKQQLFIARDRAGKKPIYYYEDQKSFVFSSELNALQRQVHDQVDEKSLRQFMRLGYFYRAATPYLHTKELPAGSFASINLSNPIAEVKKWWDIQPFYKTRINDSFDTALQKTDQFLHTAVKRRVESSDLEVGSFLSGGIDSGLVSAIAKSYNPSLKTFTVSFDGEYDEAPLAKLVAERYKTDHHEIRISYDHLRDDVEKILSNYGEPFMDSSAIPGYYVSREAKKYLTVILNGDGGVELFGGYRRFFPFARYDFLNLAQW
jgi:asparagine synthase (glutamine-hydrolysing)